MTQNFADISARLQEQAKQGVVTIDAATLPVPNAAALLDQLLGSGLLVVQNAQADATQDRVTLSGRAEIAGIEACDCMLQITSALSFNLTLTPPEEWRLGDSFPALIDTAFDNLDATSQSLTLRTHGDDGASLGVSQALRYAGTIEIARQFPGLNDILGTLGQLAVAGAIGPSPTEPTLARLTESDVLPYLALAASLPASLEISGFALHSVALHMNGPHVADWLPAPDIRRTLQAQIAVAGEEIAIEGSVSAQGSLSLSAQPKDLRLPGPQALSDLIPGVDFAAELPAELDILNEIRVTGLDLEIDTKGKTLSHAGLGLVVDTNWTIAKDIAAIERVSLYLMGGNLGRKSARVAGSLSTDIVVGGIAANVTAYAPDFTFAVNIPDLPLSTTIAKYAPSLAPILETLPEIHLSDITLEISPKTGDFSLQARSQSVWDIPIGVDGLAIRDLSIELSRDPTPKGSKEPAMRGQISGVIQIGEALINIDYAFPGDFILRGALPEIDFSPLLREIAGTSVLRDTPIPDSILNAKLEDLIFVIAPGQRYFQLAARMGMGEAEILIKKTSRGGWGCALGVAIAPDWRLSNLIPGMEALDALDLSGSGIILSTTDDDSMALSVINPSSPADDPGRDQLGKVQPKRLGSGIQKGINLFVNMSLIGTGADELLGLENLQVYAAIGPNPMNMVLEARIQTDIALGPDAAMKGVTFRMEPLSTNPSLTLLGAIEVRSGTEILRFTGSVLVSPRDAEISASMEGIWQDPLGFDGLAIGDLALSGGFSFVTLLPTIGIAGTMQIGSVTGSAALRFDTGKPENSMVAASLNRLMLIDVVDGFCTPEMQAAVPPQARDVLSSTGVEDAEVHLVPMPTRIGELEYKQGIKLKGQLFLPGFKAQVDVDIDPERGIKVFGAMSPIEIAGVFRVDGARGLPGPSLDIQLQMGEPFLVMIQGSAQLMGIEGEVFVHINERGFEFELDGKIFDLFDAHIFARGGSFDTDIGFHLKVEMRNDLMEYLRTEATRAIQAAADTAIRDLSQAQEVLDGAKAKLSVLDVEIANMRGAVRAERARDQRNLANARGEVAKAKAVVDQINDTIASMRRTVRAERKRDTDNLRNAQRAVTSAQADVDRLQSQINEQHRWIDTLNRQVAAKLRWLNAKPWYDQPWAGIEYAGYAAGKGVEISTAYTKIGAIEGAKATAWGVLEIARAAVREMENAARSIPVDADPRVASLFVGREAATAALGAATAVLLGLEEISREFPIDADPRVSTLIAAHETTKLVLEGADGTLEALKQGIGAAADVGTFIVEAGLGGLLDIRRIHFETAVSASKGGIFDLQIELVFMEQPPRTHELSFDFDNPLEGALRLAEQLLAALG